MSNKSQIHTSLFLFFSSVVSHVTCAAGMHDHQTRTWNASADAAAGGRRVVSKPACAAAAVRPFPTLRRQEEGEKEGQREGEGVNVRDMEREMEREVERERWSSCVYVCVCQPLSLFGHTESLVGGSESSSKYLYLGGGG